jgi:hypothetical protein
MAMGKKAAGVKAIKTAIKKPGVSPQAAKGLKADLAGMKSKPTKAAVSKGRAAGAALGKGLAGVVTAGSKAKKVK